MVLAMDITHLLLVELTAAEQAAIAAQQAATDKSLELAVAFSQSLSQWAYIVLGGSVAILLKDLKYRPKDSLLRHSFWLFLPGWFCLAGCIFEGIRVQQHYVARWMFNSPTKDIVNKFNSDTALQIWFMKAGLCIFAVWLAAFLIRWILYRIQPEKENEFSEY
jgi:hypothetical protein